MSKGLHNFIIEDLSSLEDAREVEEIRDACTLRLGKLRTGAQIAGAMMPRLSMILGELDPPRSTSAILRDYEDREAEALALAERREPAWKSRITWSFAAVIFLLFYWQVAVNVGMSQDDSKARQELTALKAQYPYLDNPRRYPVTERPEFCTDAMLDYLDDLRESGVVNMFGVGPYLESAFPELAAARQHSVHSSKDTHAVLAYWMKAPRRVKS